MVSNGSSTTRINPFTPTTSNHESVGRSEEPAVRYGKQVSLYAEPYVLRCEPYAVTPAQPVDPEVTAVGTYDCSTTKPPAEGGCCCAACTGNPSCQGPPYKQSYTLQLQRTCKTQSLNGAPLESGSLRKLVLSGDDGPLLVIPASMDVATCLSDYVKQGDKTRLRFHVYVITDNKEAQGLGVDVDDRIAIPVVLPPERSTTVVVTDIAATASGQPAGPQASQPS